MGMSLFKPNIEKMEKKGDVRGLIKALQATDLSEKAILALGRIGDAEVVDPLVQILRDKDQLSIRETSAYALGEIGDPRAVEPLIEVLEIEGEIWHKEVKIPGFASKLREAAARALGKIGNDEAVKALIEAFIRALRQDDYHAQGATAASLHHVGKPAAEPLIRALKDEDENIQAGALGILVGMIRDEVVQVLRDDKSQ
jgi:HEAT repeat protein